MQKLSKKFISLLLFSFAVWSVVPMLRLSLSMDTQEAIVWGKYCLFGTTKHAPLSGWVAYAWYTLFGQSDKAMYALSQLFVLLGVVYIYKLARCFLDETKAILAAALQFGIIYYGYSTPEYNVNVVSVGLWPLCAYYFWRAYTLDKWRDWLLFGISVGLNLLNKYTAVMLLIALGIFVLCDKKFTKLLKNYKVYAAAIIAVSLFAPHVYWLYEHDFVSFNYISSRSHGGNITSFWRHFVYPLKFLFAQILFAAPALLTYFYFWGKHKTGKPEFGTTGCFIFCTAVIPAAMFSLICLVSGNAAKSMWGFPCLFMWGTALFYFAPLKTDGNMADKFLNTMFVWVALLSTAYGVQCLLTSSQRYQTDVRSVAAKFEQKWAQHTAKPLKYVGADVWFGNMMALYASHEIKPMIWMNPENNPWFDRNDFEKSGALLIATDDWEFLQYQKLYGDAVSAPQKMTLEFKNYFGKTKTKEILYGFYEPWEVKSAE